MSLDCELSPGGTCRTQTALSPWQGDTAAANPGWARPSRQLCSTPLLTHVGEHSDAALHRCLLAGHEPGAVVHPEHPLQQLHEHGLPSLQGKHSTESQPKPTLRAGLSPAQPQNSCLPLLTALQHLLGNSPWWQGIYHGISNGMGRVGTNAARET